MVKIKADIDDYAAQVEVKMLWEAAKEVRKGALTNSVMQAAYQVADRDFNKFMAKQVASRKDLRHVFDWGQNGKGVGPRLWVTAMTGNNSSRVVGYTFLESRVSVPVPKVLRLRRKHKFRDKADMFENAKDITVKRLNSNWLTWPNRNEEPDESGKVNPVIFRKGPTHPGPAGGGMYKDKFYTTFVAWWSSDLGGGGSLDKVAQNLGNSFVFQRARVAAAKRRMATYSGILNDRNSTAEAKKRAKEMMAAVQRQMSDYARRG